MVVVVAVVVVVVVEVVVVVVLIPVVVVIAMLSLKPAAAKDSGKSLEFSIPSGATGAERVDDGW